MSGLDRGRASAAETSGVRKSGPGAAFLRQARWAVAAAGLLGLLAALPAVAQQGTAPAAADDGLTPPPVIDPRPVETRPVVPGGAGGNPAAAPEGTQSGAPFATPREVILAPVPVLALSGSATWDEAYDKLVASIRTATAELARLGLTRAGDIFVAYASSDDLGFEFEVQVPFSGTTTVKPADGMKLGGSYAGRVLRFTHTGSFADMDSTYEQIANYLDEKNISSEDLYIEQYRTDLVGTAPDALTIDILVPLP